jgi:hypothetical protein
MPMQRTLLAAALDAGLSDAALYPWRGMALSNHLPMALHAAFELGGDAACLDRHRAHWAGRVVPMDPDERARVAAFEQAIAARGAERVLADALPELLRSPQAGAFHGMIRLSHAWLSGHDGERARALAAWSAGAFTLGAPAPVSPGPARADHDLRAVLDAALADPALACSPGEGTIIADLHAAAATPGFEAYADGPAAPSDAALTPAALAEASLAVYLGCREFTALHLVTGVHAFRVLTTAAPQPTEATRVQRRAVWRAWLAAWVSMGCPAPDFHAVHAGTADEADWAAARSELLRTTNDHRVKLAYSAREEWRHWGLPGYARVLESVD